jgi:hypothetical protein
MKRPVRRVVLLLLALAVLGLVFGWPRINDVETGKTKEYPDLTPATYDVPPERVYTAAREIAETASGWKVAGHGFGPGSWTVTLVRTPAFVPLAFDVRAKITRQGGKAQVSVRSTSRWGKWDCGQNARNIREFLRLLDEKLKT